MSLTAIERCGESTLIELVVSRIRDSVLGVLFSQTSIVLKRFSNHRLAHYLWMWLRTA